MACVRNHPIPDLIFRETQQATYGQSECMGESHRNCIANLSLDRFMTADKAIVRGEGLEQCCLTQADAAVLNRVDEPSA